LKVVVDTTVTNKLQRVPENTSKVLIMGVPFSIYAAGAISHKGEPADSRFRAQASQFFIGSPDVERFFSGS
jgi:hypothetical protein